MIASQLQCALATSGLQGRYAPPPRVRFRGFTIVEMMLVVAVVGVLATIAVSSYGRYRERVQILQAASDIGSLQPLISKYALDNNGYPDSLADIDRAGLVDPWGHSYQYISHDDNTTRGQWRKDHNIVPVNSDYDLWSNGKDGLSSPPLTAAHSRDDIVRANNGRFIGLASDLDP